MARKTPSLAGRAVLAVLLMIGFYALALGICAVLAVLVWADMQGGRVHPKLWIIAGVTIGIVLWSVWPRAAKFPDPGVRLTQRAQPKLWQLVTDIAKRAGQAPPREVFLVPQINAFVAERNSRLGFGGTRILGVGLPLLQVLSVPQLESVLAHEFGHFHGGDTRLGPFVYRTREAIGRTVRNFQKAESLLQKPFEWYGKLFLRVTFAISRAQEFAADALAVRLFGREPARSALRRVNEVGPLYEHYLESEYFPMLNRGLRPPLAAGFDAYLGSRAIQQLQVDLGEQAMQARGNPYDSHPPLPERLAAVDEVDGAKHGAADGPAAITVLADLPDLEARLLVFLTGKQDVLQVPAAAWHDSGEVHARGWRRLVAQHGRQLPPLTLADVPAQRSQLEALAVALDAKIPAQERRAAGAWLLGALLGDALVRSGFAVETAPGDPIALVRGELRIEPFAVGRQLADGALEPAAWQQLCAAHGLADVVLAGPALPAAPAAADGGSA